MVAAARGNRSACIAQCSTPEKRFKISVKANGISSVGVERENLFQSMYSTEDATLLLALFPTTLVCKPPYSIDQTQQYWHLDEWANGRC